MRKRWCFVVLVSFLCTCGECGLSRHCKESQDVVPVRPHPAAVEQKIREPHFNLSLDSQEKVVAWQLQTFEAARILSTPVDTAKLDGYQAAFKVTDKSIAQYIETDRLTEFTLEDSERHRQDEPVSEVIQKSATTPQQALEWEAQRQDYEAGLLYAQLGNKDAVKRCIARLEKKLEWNAVAVLAYRIDDHPKMYSAMSKMRELSWEYRMRDLISTMIADKKITLAEQVATNYSWNLWSGEWDQALRQTGDTSAFRRLVERDIRQWIEQASAACRDEQDKIICEGVAYNLGWKFCESWGQTTPNLADIVRLSKSDRAGALAIAKDFLSSRYANVVSVSDECGEGGHTHLVSGTMEFYQLVKSDPTLAASYIGKIRQWAQGNVVREKDEQGRPVDEQGYEMYEAREYLQWPGAKFYAAVKALGDQALIASWGENLLTQALLYHGDRFPAQERQEIAFHRYQLGFPDGSTDVINPFTYGEIAPSELTRIWKELALSAPAQDSGITIERLDQLAQTVSKLKWQGYEGEAKTALAAVLGPEASELSYDGALIQIQLWKAFLSLEKGDVTLAREIVADEVRRRRSEEEDRKKGSTEKFETLLVQPYAVLEYNRREESSMIPLLPAPVNDQAANLMIAPILTALEQKFPDLLEQAVVLLALKGHRSFLDEQVKLRTQKGDLEGVQRLLSRLGYLRLPSRQ